MLFRSDNYLPIRFFEAWKSYIMNEGQTAENHTPKNKNYSYRVNYPDGDKGYTATGLTITKFERDYRGSLTYEFIKSYPISISAMPVSYDTSGLLKCTVSMTYLRYVIAQTGQFSMGNQEKPTSSENPNSTTPKSAWTSFDESVTGQDFSKYFNPDKTNSLFNQPLTGDPAGWSSW